MLLRSRLPPVASNNASLLPLLAAAAGHYVIIVSSGAVGLGCQRLGPAQRPTKLAQKQALAAIGQVHLMRYYEDILNALRLVSEFRMLQTLQCMHCSKAERTFRCMCAKCLRTTLAPLSIVVVEAAEHYTSQCILQLLHLA
jgi:glutamate 5-kinase